jgi:hypothetical protein
MKRYGTFAVGLLAITAIAAVAVLGFDVSLRGSRFRSVCSLHRRIRRTARRRPKELKAVFDRIGEAFKSLQGRPTRKSSRASRRVLTTSSPRTSSKVQEALDKGVEAKAALDAAMEAEKKHVDELERSSTSSASTIPTKAKQILELKSSTTLKSACRRAQAAVVAARRQGLRRIQVRLGPLSARRQGQPDAGRGQDPVGRLRSGRRLLRHAGHLRRSSRRSTRPARCASMRRCSTISTDALEGIEDLGEAGVGYAGEPRRATPPRRRSASGRSRCSTIDTEPKATQNLLDDANVDVEAGSADKVGDKIGRFENSEFVTGAPTRSAASWLRLHRGADSGSGVTWGRSAISAPALTATSPPRQGRQALST